MIKQSIRSLFYSQAPNSKPEVYIFFFFYFFQTFLQETLTSLDLVEPYQDIQFIKRPIEISLGMISTSSLTTEWSLIVCIALFIKIFVTGMIIWLLFTNKLEHSNAGSLIPVLWKNHFNIVSYILTLYLLNFLMNSILDLSSGLDAIQYISFVMLVISNILCPIINIFKRYLSIQLKTEDYASSSNEYWYFSRFVHLYFECLVLNLNEFSNTTPYVIVINLVFNSLIYYRIVEDQPFFHKKIQILFQIGQSLLLSTSISNALASFFNKKSIVEVIVMTMFLFAALIKFSFNRRDIILNRHLLPVLSMKDIDYRSISPQMLYKLSKVVSWHGIFDLNKKLFWKKTFHNNSIKMFLEEKINQKDTPHFFKIYIDFLLTKANLTIAQQITLAHILLKNHTDFIGSYMLIRKILAKDRGLQKNDKRTAMWINYKISSNFHKYIDYGEKNRLICDYIKGIEFYDILASKLQNHYSFHSSIYKHLLNPNPDLYKLLKTCYKTEKSFDSIMHTWNKLPRDLIESNPKILSHFISFLESTGLRRDLEYDLFALHKNIMNRQQHDEEEYHTDLYSAFLSQRSIIVECHLKKDVFCKISKIFPSMKLLGYPKKELLDKHISELFPLSLKTFYQNLIQNKLNSDEKLLSPFKIETFLRHRNGHILPVTCYSMINPNVYKEITLLSLFCIKQEEICEYLIYNQQKTLDSTTLKFFNRIKDPGLQTVPALDGLRFDKLLLDQRNYRPREYYTIADGKYKLGRYEHPETDATIVQATIYIGDNMMTVLKRVTKKRNQTKLLTLEYGVMQEENFIEDFMKEKPQAEIYASTNRIPTLTLDSRIFNDSGNIVSSWNGMEIASNANLSNVTKSQNSLNIQTESNNFAIGNFNQNKRHIEIQRRIQNSIEDVLPRMKLYRFTSKHFLFFGIVLMVATFSVALIDSRSSANIAVTEVKKSAYLIRAIFARTVSLSSMFTIAFADHLYKTYYDNTVNLVMLIRQYNYLLSPTRISMIMDQHREIRQLVDQMRDSNLRTVFFEKNIRVFYDNFDHIPDQGTYYMKDNFEAVEILVQAAEFYSNHMLIRNDSTMAFYGNFIMTLAKNDLWIEHKTYPDIVEQSMKDLLTSVNSSTEALYYFSIAILCSAIILVLYELVLYYKRIEWFLVLLINSDKKQIYETISALNKHNKKEFVKLNTRQDEMVAKKSAQKERLSWKNGKRNSLLFNLLLFRVIFTMIAMIPPLIFLLLIYQTPSETLDFATQRLRDIRNLNDIGIAAVELLDDATIYDFIPTIRSKNKPVTFYYSDEIQNIDLTVSTSKQFDEEILDMLGINLCNYYIQNFIKPDCSALNNGEGMRGVKSSIYFLKQYYFTFKKWADSIPDSFEKKSTLNNVPDRTDTVFLVFQAMLPALQTFSKQLTDELVANLQKKLEKVEDIVVLYFSYAGLVVVLTIRWIYFILANERRKIAKILRVLSLDVILNNKALKSFLESETKDFKKLTLEEVQEINV